MNPLRSHRDLVLAAALVLPGILETARAQVLDRDRDRDEITDEIESLLGSGQLDAASAPEGLFFDRVHDRSSCDGLGCLDGACP